jgi:hypothetical protein
MTGHNVIGQLLARGETSFAPAIIQWQWKSRKSTQFQKRVKDIIVIFTSLLYRLNISEVSEEKILLKQVCFHDLKSH